MPKDWGSIATYVSPRAHGQGIGATLFTQTRRAAQAAGLIAIDATIRRENTGGQAFYDRLGFRDHRDGPETVSKRFDVAGADRG